MSSLIKDIKTTLNNNICNVQSLDVAADRNRVCKEITKIINQDLKKTIYEEIKSIKKEHDMAQLDYVDTDRMDSNDAFAKGYITALEFMLDLI